jgi:hypothetical protein
MTQAQPVQRLAAAFAVGAAVALVVDVVLQNALATVRSPGVLSMTPWWVVGRLMERSTWVAAALLVWTFAPRFSPVITIIWPQDHVVSRPAAFDIVGRLMLALPLLWLAATWLVWVVKITFVGGWASEGRIFVAGYYYYNVLLGYAPWAGGGLSLLMLRRHVADS